MLCEFCPIGGHNPKEAPNRKSQLNLTKKALEERYSNKGDYVIRKTLF